MPKPPSFILIKPEEIERGRCALLAAFPKAPTGYNPSGKPAKIRDRKNLVLRRMLELKMIPLWSRGKKLDESPHFYHKTGKPHNPAHLRATD